MLTNATLQWTLAAALALAAHHYDVIAPPLHHAHATVAAWVTSR